MRVVKLTFTIEPEDDGYVATCFELDIASQGSTVEDAMRHLDDAVSLYLSIMEEDGELDQVIRERHLEIIDISEPLSESPAGDVYVTEKHVALSA